MFHCRTTVSDSGPGPQGQVYLWCKKKIWLQNFPTYRPDRHGCPREVKQLRTGVFPDRNVLTSSTSLTKTKRERARKGKQSSTLCPLLQSPAHSILTIPARRQGGGRGYERKASERLQAKRSQCFQCNQAELIRCLESDLSAKYRKLNLVAGQAKTPISSVCRPNLQWATVHSCPGIFCELCWLSTAQSAALI